MMGNGLTLKEVRVSGFRGYGEEPATIDLDSPVVILSGGNRSGKSSTLNAIEWAIYGGEVVGSSKVGIEERKGWLVRNRNCKTASVDLVLKSGEGELTVHRSISGKARKATDFHFIDESGERHTDEEELWSRLGLGPRDFMSSAYLHQEVIRDILVTTPQVRKSALDRLLGVSDLRNLYDAFKAFKKGSYDARITSIYERLEDLVSSRTDLYEERITEAKERGTDMGLEKGDYTKDGFMKKARSAVDLLGKLARRAGVEPSDIEVPSGPDGFGDFSSGVAQEVRRLRVENPGAESQRKLDSERRSLDRALSGYLGAVETVSGLKKEKKQIEKEHGSAADLEKKREKLAGDDRKAGDELSKISGRINVINETIDYLEKIEDSTKKSPCPACGQEIIPAELLEHLKAEKDSVRRDTRALEERRRELRRKKKALSEILDRLREIKDEDLPDAKERVKEALADLEEALGREIAREEDPEVAVKKRQDEIQKELERNKKLLEQYTEGLSEVEEVLDAAGCVADVLLLKKKIKEINRIRESKEWAAMDRAREKLDAELDRVDKVRDAVEEVLGEVSRRKVREAKGRILDFYRRLVERPDFSGIEIDPDNYDVYAVSDGEREKLVGFFNQGDMNCAALSIFLALGTGSRESGGVSFLMLDDPSQSLDDEQKGRLASLLDHVAKESQVILATMDDRLAESASERISRMKRHYNLGAWDPLKGPEITEV